MTTNAQNSPERDRKHDFNQILKDGDELFNEYKLFNKLLIMAHEK